MADAVRFAIVGLGMGRGRADRCMETEGAELVAICDLSEERGTAASGELGVPWVRSYDELLARDDVDVIGLSILSGAHMDLFPQIFDGLELNEMQDVPVIAGGIIPESDRIALEEMGVSAIYGPGTPTTDIVERVREVAAERQASL